MLSFNYIVKRIDGDYAFLECIGENNLELKMVARALLPFEIEEGTRLRYEYLEYTIEK